MDIERVVLCTELLKKSSHVDFWIDKEVYAYNNVQETVEKLKKQYGLFVKVLNYNGKIRIIVKVKQ